MPTTKPRLQDKYKHRNARCTADRLRPEQTAAGKTWEVYIGIIQVVIIGPGENQWYPVSRGNYGGPVGTPEERLIADRTVAILNANHPSGDGVTKATITMILKDISLGVTKL